MRDIFKIHPESNTNLYRKQCKFVHFTWLDPGGKCDTDGAGKIVYTILLESLGSNRRTWEGIIKTVLRKVGCASIN
jgi:hypothetical protein